MSMKTPSYSMHNDSSRFQLTSAKSESFTASAPRPIRGSPWKAFSSKAHRVDSMGAREDIFGPLSAEDDRGAEKLQSAMEKSTDVALAHHFSKSNSSGPSIAPSEGFSECDNGNAAQETEGESSPFALPMKQKQQQIFGPPPAEFQADFDE